MHNPVWSARAEFHLLRGVTQNLGLSFDKTLCGSEINHLKNFLSQVSVMNSTYVRARASLGLSTCSTVSL